MQEIIYLQEKCPIPSLKEGWENRGAFDGCGQKIDYEGRSYQIVGKHDLHFTLFERISRLFEGVLKFLLFVFTFGQLSDWKSVEELFAQESKESSIFARICSEEGKTVGESISGSGSSKVESHCSEEAEAEFFTQAEQFSFLSACLDQYNNAAADSRFESVEGMICLCLEFREIRSALEELKEVAEKSERSLSEGGCEERCNLTSSTPIGNSFGDVAGAIDPLIADIDARIGLLQKTIEEKLDGQGQEVKREARVSVRGFQNVGNSCYINSALQPLLAIGNFSDLVPKVVAPEPAENRVERQRILDSLNDFLDSWRSKKGAGELGGKIGALRREIFKAGLFEGGFLNPAREKSFQDAGQFFELILSVIGQGFSMELKKRAIYNGATVKDRSEITNEGSFQLKRPGVTVQEKVDAYRDSAQESFTDDNLWRVKDPLTGNRVFVRDYLEEQKILGEPPNVVVLRVDRVVDPSVDFEVDFAPLFKDSEEPCRYQLVGFSQNHHQVHWTSVVYNGSGWSYCNDDAVRGVNPGDRSFVVPANYMVYKRK